MYSQEEIEDRIATLKEYSVEKDSATASLFTPLETAVQTYFNASNDMAEALRDVVKYMYNDISRRTTVYETEWPDNLPTDSPAGYSDLRECLYGFDELMSISEETFSSGFSYASASDGGAATVSENTYITKWTADITAYASSVADSLSNVAVWCRDAGGNSDLIDLLEDRGTVVSSMTRDEIAEEIYINRGVLEIIEAFGADVYIPTSVSS